MEMISTFNFSIPPQVRVSSGSSSEYKAIVTNGKIQSVIVTRSGGEYTSTPDLTILGDGVAKKIISSISNGRVDSVVDNGGVGYTTALVSVQEKFLALVRYSYQKLDLGLLTMSKDTRTYSMVMMDS